MKIGITGGAGFIGSTIAEQLKEDHEVLVIDNFSSGREENIPDGVEVLEFDLKDEGLEEYLEDVDTIFHFAANPKVNTFPDDRGKDFNENFVGTKNVLDACVDAEVGNIVFASSSVVYGERPRFRPLRTTDLIPSPCTALQRPATSTWCKCMARHSI